MKKHLKNYGLLYLISLMAIIVIGRDVFSAEKEEDHIGNKGLQSSQKQPAYWRAPDFNFDHSTKDPQQKMIIYGHDLIANTSKYFGPEGSLMAISNGLNCQNCHLDAGTRPWANNYAAVAATYPKYRKRSGSIENIPQRVNDCFRRSLNGKAIDTAGYEMKSIVAYFQWLGQNVKKGERPEGSGITNLKYLDRAANPVNGQVVYNLKCQRCHGANGEGQKNINDTGYYYPPLWGKHSFNTGAGLYRLSRFAGYVRDNMPFDQATHDAPVLSDEEAWDVAAFVNSRPRPQGDIKKDWPDISEKPVDHPFGPYADGFSVEQHKYGPFQPIVNRRIELKRMHHPLNVKKL